MQAPKRATSVKHLAKPQVKPRRLNMTVCFFHWPLPNGSTAVTSLSHQRLDRQPTSLGTCSDLSTATTTATARAEIADAEAFHEHMAQSPRDWAAVDESCPP
ncbi:hypothetical protein RJ55_06197 [Drechmeria coniospora]|nr:hypothetical protein RJ55_06197 [Drechmeria coniospora]